MEQGKILKKIFECTKEFEPLIKDKNNDFTKSKYTSLPALLSTVKPVLEDRSILLTQPIEDGIVYTRLHDLESGEFVESSLVIPENQDPQRIGSAITYYRRYTLQSLLGIHANDDDGNATHVGQKRKKRLTEAQFKNLLLPENFHYIEAALKGYQMKAEYREKLEQILDQS